MMARVRYYNLSLITGKKIFPAFDNVFHVYLKSKGPILRVTSSETRSVCVKQALNSCRWLVNALVTWHVSYKITTLLVRHMLDWKVDRFCYNLQIVEKMKIRTPFNFLPPLLHHYFEGWLSMYWTYFSFFALSTDVWLVLGVNHQWISLLTWIK